MEYTVPVLLLQETAIDFPEIFVYPCFVTLCCRAECSV